MPARPIILFDFDDTLSDPIPFFLQFAREIGLYLSHRFGLETSAWEHAAADMLIAVQEDYWERFRGNPTNGYLDWLSALRPYAIRMLFEPMQLPIPSNTGQLFHDLQFESLSKCHAGFPGAEVVVKDLADRGYVLHMASGQESEYLRGGLTGLGLTPYFGKLFGPDLIDCAKEGPEYYELLLKALGVRSDEVIVVDDYPPAIGWAVQVGIRVIQSNLSPVKQEPIQPGISAIMTDMHDLPQLIDQVVAKGKL